MPVALIDRVAYCVAYCFAICVAFRVAPRDAGFDSNPDAERDAAADAERQRHGFVDLLCRRHGVRHAISERHAVTERDAEPPSNGDADAGGERQRQRLVDADSVADAYAVADAGRKRVRRGTDRNVHALADGDASAKRACGRNGAAVAERASIGVPESDPCRLGAAHCVGARDGDRVGVRQRQQQCKYLAHAVNHGVADGLADGHGISDGVIDD